MESSVGIKEASITLDRGLASAFALAVCLSASTVFAGQNPQGQPAPTSSPQGPPATHQPVPQTLSLAAGALIQVRVSQWLSSDQNRAGDSFSADLQQPLVSEGWVVAQRGQTVLGRVAVSQKAGRVSGVSQLGVELIQLSLVDGQQIPIRTQLQQASAGTSRGRDAAAIGTTTGTGAAVGGVAGGGKGAGIGAAIGAAAGVAGVLVTRGRPTVIPPESLLTFQLQYPITISTERSSQAFRPVNQQDYGQEMPRRAPQRFASGPYSYYPPPTPPYYYAYYPWPYYSFGYYYPYPLIFGFHRPFRFGPRFFRPRFFGPRLDGRGGRR